MVAAASLNNPAIGDQVAAVDGTPTVTDVVMLIDHDVSVPVSVPTLSPIASVQVPLADAEVGVSAAQLFTVCMKPIGPKPARASAAKVPVRGAGAPLMAAPPGSELNTVLVKLSVALPPVPPSNEPTRFKIALFGALRFTSTSPTQVWLIFMVTLISLTFAPVGTPATVRFEVAATLVPSGIGTLMVPEDAVTFEVVVVEELAIKRTAGSPKHIVTDDGVTEGAGGV